MVFSNGFCIILRIKKRVQVHPYPFSISGYNPNRLQIEKLIHEPVYSYIDFFRRFIRAGFDFRLYSRNEFSANFGQLLYLGGQLRNS